jgi:hypothetical protein
MILKIQADRNAEILKCENGEMILKVNYYSAFANGAWVVSASGNSLEDLKGDNAQYKKGKMLFVGNNGGLSLE